jgi:hypothetical protein
LLRLRSLRYLLPLVAAGAWFIGTFALAWEVLPGPHMCRSFDCGDQFESGAAPIFGHENFTWPQSIVMLIGILGALAILVLGTIKARQSPGP